ncbi:ROK family protein [Pararhizobium sp. PWRC1-1]|uniref:ROK family protein n=1 Tax=Pararhizobium sp. PWRC1-1 TaxID=2804566 RepID=UPI003CED6DEE
MWHAIGIDIGGGSTKIGLVSEIGEVLERSRIPANPGDRGDAIVESYVTAIRKLVPLGVRVSGVGIGYPGPIHDANLSGGVGNVPGLINFPLATSLSAALNLPARLENDATAAALAEARFGAGSKAKRLLMITAGTGIGVAMIVDGRAMVTSGGCLGDAGHMIMDARGQRCRLGCIGCLEALASGEALDLIAAERSARDPDGAIARQARTEHTQASAATLVICALAGDADARIILANAGRWMGRAVASWVHTFAPDTVVIGGGLSAAGQFLLAPLEDEARRCGLPGYMGELRFVRASLGNDAGIVGAAAQMLPPLDNATGGLR